MLHKHCHTNICEDKTRTYSQEHTCTLQKVGKAASDAMPLDRTNKHTAGYAEACISVGREMGVPCVDLYNSLQKEQVGCSLHRVLVMRLGQVVGILLAPEQHNGL